MAASNWSSPDSSAPTQHLRSMLAEALPIRVTVGWLMEASMNEYNPFSYIIGGCCDSCFGCYRRLFELSL